MDKTDDTGKDSKLIYYWKWLLAVACILMVVFAVALLVARGSRLQWRELPAWVYVSGRLRPLKPQVTTYDYSSSLQLPLGQKIRPTPSAAVNFELLYADTNRQQCGFRVTINGDPKTYEGTVQISNLFTFCPPLHHIGVYLQEIRATSAIVVVPGLVRR